jgi:hypothetical protein
MRTHRIVIFLLICWLTAPLMSQISGEKEGIDELIHKIQISLNNRDMQSYLGFFKAGLREMEEVKLRSMWDDFKIEEISLHKAFTRTTDENTCRLILRVKYENDYSVIIELWTMDLVFEDSRWQINSKDVSSEVQTLYKIVIPSDSVARARRVEIQHADIQIDFEEAAVFFDNIPNTETALLVIGKGSLHFFPSSAREQHQLDLLWGSPVLSDELKYIYIRCSNSFFSRNIKISGIKGGLESISKSEMNKAYSLFVKHYSQSYTIESSLDGKLLSFLPQGDEVVFEFEGEKIGGFSYIYSPFAEEEINLIALDEQRIVNLYSPQEEDDEQQLFISIGQKFDITDYDIDINYRPKDSYFSGKARISVESERGLLDVLKFKLNSGLQILRVNNEEKQNLFHSVDKFRQTLYVYLPSSRQNDKSALIEIFYRGSVEPDTSLADAVIGPQYDDSVLQVPPRAETYLYTKSSFWYPAPADDDYFTATIRITVPPGYSVVSTGARKENYEIDGFERVEDIERVGSTVCVYQTGKPVKYISFIAGRLLTVEEEKQSSYSLKFYKTYDIRGGKWDYLGEAKKMLSFFESKFGAYPYESFSIVQRLMPQEGGHSPPSFIVLNELPQVPEGYRRILNSSPVDLSRWKEYYLAHEIAHQWWGQCVTWNSYHEQWLSEGMSQFAAVLYLENKYGAKVLPWIFKKFSQGISRTSKWGAITMGSRISYFDYEAFQSIVYNKTALVFYLLRDFLGDDVFFSALKEFLSLKRFSPARTREFIAVFERVSGLDLSPFFYPWLDSYLLPEITVQHSIQKSGEKTFLTFRIVQANELFMFPLWLEWKEGGTKRREKILVKERIHDFRFPVSRKPTRISINPDDAVPGIFR